MTTGARGSRHVAPERPRRSPPPVGFELDESKLLVPGTRDGMVPRTDLVERLLASHATPIVAVVAPAGYGKSTLLAEWAGCRQPRVAWVSMDRRDNDPTVLLTYIAAALDRVERLEPSVFRSLASRGAGIVEVARLTSVMGRMDAPVLLVLDHAEEVTSPASLDMIAELSMRLPEGSQLAIGSRRDVPVPVARLRAQRGVVEVGIDQLAMDRPAAHALLAGAGVVGFSDPEVGHLVRRTEGWPAGLYLAALAMKAGSSHLAVTSTFTGDDRFVADYLRSELLDRVSRADVSFLTRTSILERMTGSLCDQIVGRSGSSRLLRRLESRNLLVLPLDRTGGWYRYHHLFRELLHAELMRREPEMVTELHARAATWYEDNDLPEAAVDHAQQAGDGDRVARLVLRIANPVWASGRLDTVLRWMEWFSDNGLLERQPAVAVHGALIFALVGRPGDAERWAEAAQRTTVTGGQVDGNTMEGTLAYLSALLCRDGLDQMRTDAQTARRGLAPTSPYRPAMLHAEAVADLLQGHVNSADVLFSRAADEATSAGVVPFVPLALAERGIVAIARDEWEEAEALVGLALEIMRGNTFDDYWTSALVYAWGARVLAHRADFEQARDLVRRAARLRPLLTYALPIVSAQALVQLAHAYLALADPDGARAALRQLRDLQHHRPGLGTLPHEADELRSQLDVPRGDVVGVASLTTAELRLLPLLPTHLTLAQISERLFVSRNTVKTQAISVYRKLGVSSRSETVARMHELGLLAPT